MKKIMYKSLILIMLLAVAGSMSAQSFGAEMPQAGFTSTGTMMGSGSAYSSTPTISDNGTAGDPYSATPSRVGARGYTPPPGTPDEEEEEPEFIPIGEPLVMLFFAAAAGVVIALRRRKAA